MIANRSQPQVSPLLIMAVLALAIALVAVATLPALHDIPFTQHAQKGHTGQLFTAETIAARISSRSCKPILSYSCTNQIIVMCPVGAHDDLWTGLIIGTATGSPVVVTGYAAPAEYWMKRVEGCLPVSYVP